jgi:hypothetical protein
MERFADGGIAVTLTRWIDVRTERYLSRTEVADRRRLARDLYEANAHLFEDERDALAALGTVPMSDYERLERSSPRCDWSQPDRSDDRYSYGAGDALVERREMEEQG